MKKRRQKRREKKRPQKEKQKKEGQKGGGRFFPHTTQKKEEKVFPLQKLSLQYIRRRRERGFFFLENICSWWKVDRNARARTGSTTPGRTKFPDGRCAKKENFFFPFLGIRVVENIFEIISFAIRERKRMMMLRRTKSLVRSFGLRSLSGTSFRKPRKDERHFGGATDETRRASSLSLSDARLSLPLFSFTITTLWTSPQTTQKMVTMEGAKNPSTPSKKSTPSSTGKLHTTPGKQQNAGGSAKKKDESQLGMTTIQTTTKEQQQQQQQQQPAKKKRGRPVGWRKADHSNKYKSMREAAGNARKALGGRQHKRYYSDDEDEFDSEDYGGEAFNKYNTQGSDDEGGANDRKRGRPSSSQRIKKQPIPGKRGPGRPRKIQNAAYDEDDYQYGMQQAQIALERNKHQKRKTEQAFDRAESRKYLMLQDRYESLQRKYDDLKKKKVDEVAMAATKMQEAMKEKQRAQETLISDLRRDRDFFQKEAARTHELAEEKGNMKVEIFKLQEELVQKGTDMLAIQKANRKLRDDLKIALTNTDAGNSFGPPQFESISGLRWRKLGQDQNNKHEFKHVLTGFTFTIEAGEDPKTHAITGEDPLNYSILPDQVSTHCSYTPTSLGILPLEKVEEMLREEMEFSTKHIAHFFTKVLEFLMTACQELGFVPTEEEEEDDDGGEDGGEDGEEGEEGGSEPR